MTAVLLVWLVHAAPVKPWMPGDVVAAAARGAVRGAVVGPVPDDRAPGGPVLWDDHCGANPLAKGCM